MARRGDRPRRLIPVVGRRLVELEHLVERQLPGHVFAFLEVGRGAPHAAPPTVTVVPETPEGVCRLAGAIRDVDERAERPVMVWWWDVDAREERRGTVYGWRDSGGGRLALLVTRGMWDACRVGGDCVRWVPADLTRERSE